MFTNLQPKLAALCLVLSPLAVSAADTAGRLESPAAGSINIGTGNVFGWHCTARQIEVWIDGSRFGTMTPGITRGNVDCSGFENANPRPGYSMQINYNMFVPGRHEVVVFADGVSESSWTFTISQEGLLEIPGSESTQSGIGMISGWHCTAREVEVHIDGRSMGKMTVNSPRQDVRSANPGCSNPLPGYGMLFNYNLLNPGEHYAEVLADGKLQRGWSFRSAQSGNEEFLTGVNRTAELENFPTIGQTAVLAWSEEAQNFVVSDIRDNRFAEGDGTPLSPRLMKLNQRNEITNRGFVNNYKVEMQRGERVRVDVELFYPETEDAYIELCFLTTNLVPEVNPITVRDTRGQLADSRCGTVMEYTALSSGMHVFQFDFGRNGQGSFFPVRY
jgi:hypothetical protein